MQRAPRPRYLAVDIARGVAFVAMFAYHAAYFAAARDLVAIPIGTDPAWRAFQKAIAGSFYLLVGVSLVLANPDRIRPAPFGRRLGKLAIAALTVTVASAALDRRLLVTYGILHNIAVCSVVGLALLRLGPLNLVLGAIAVAIGATVASPAFDAPAIAWLGLGTTHPPTFDFQPFLPWVGVVLWGLAAGRAIAGAPAIGAWSSSAPWARGLALVGRHTLFLYMAHVPVLVVAVEAAAWLLR